MAGKCDICGKTKSFGHNVSHSKRRTNRDFRPNVQRKRLLIGNELVRVHVCTRCMRTAQKSGKLIQHRRKKLQGRGVAMATPFSFARTLQ